MRRLLSALRSRWALGLAAVAAFSALLWWYGPLLSFDGRTPFARASTRLGWMLATLALWAACLLWHKLRARIDSRRLADGIADDPAPGDLASAAEAAALKERMRQAMALLRRRHHGVSLARLPWYLFLGPPGSGKTTALLQSGLHFPLASMLGENTVRGVGGTRNCDWWFADEAVLLDTAGRYTTQDSDAAADRDAWLGFLDLLRRHRRRLPINGLIVTVSMADLLASDPVMLRAQARAVRERLAEVQRRLRIRAPVYVMVTKCDLLAGFLESFDAMGREEREQVWGVSFPVSGPEGAKAALDSFGAQFDALERRLQDRMLQRLEEERDLRRRALIFGFPQGFACIREELETFLRDAFEPSVYETPAMLRGVYFTSGTQEGNPVDRVMGAMARSLGLGSDALPPNLAEGRSYFLGRLLRDLILREADLAGASPGLRRERRLLRRTAMAAVVLALVLGWAGLYASYGRNRAYVAEVDASARRLAAMAHALPSNADLAAVLPLLDAARAIPGGYAQREDAVPLLNRFGLYQGGELGQAAQTLYRHLLGEALAPRLIARIEEALRRGDADGSDFLYETLRVYLMLDDSRQFQADAVQAWFDVDASRNLPGLSADMQASLSRHVAALLATGGMRLTHGDAAMVRAARQTLERTPLAQRVYQRALRAPALARLPAFVLADAGGAEAALVFTRASGRPLDEGMAGIFTAAGYRSLLAALDGAIEELANESWVLNKPAMPVAERSKLRDAALQLYYADFIGRWEALLADLRIAPLSSLDDAARLLALLGAPDSPLKAIARAAARETTLEPVNGDADTAKGSDDQASARMKAAQKRLKAALVGGQAETAARADNPVEEHFQALHKLAGPAGAKADAAPIDQTLAVLKDAALYLDAVNGARRAGTAAPASDMQARLRREAEGKPAMLAGMLKAVESGTAILALGNERTRLNALWNPSAQFCREAIAQRYPFARGAAQEVTPDDFGRLFAPGGMIDDFVAKNIAAYIDMSGSQWRWRASSDMPAAISAQALANFQRAARIRDMFFASGGRLPLLRFTVKSVNMDPALARVELDIDGQVLVHAFGALPPPAAVQVPSGKGVGQVRLQAASGDELRTDGPWAWLRMMDKGTLESTSQGERFLLTFAIDDRKATYELIASSVVNPFQRAVLEQFRCPEQL